MNGHNKKHGVVGRFHAPDRLVGWVFADPNNGFAQVTVKYKNNVVARGVAKQPRQQRKNSSAVNKFGFNLRLNTTLTINEIRSNCLEVFAEIGNEVFLLEKANSILSCYSSSQSTSACHEDEVTNVSVAVGTISDDNAAVIGKSGIIFLIGGTNDVYGMYQNRSDNGLSQKWIDLVKLRTDTLRSKRIRFLQVFIPEKSSVLSQFFPFQIQAPSVVYEHIRKKSRKDNSTRENILFLDDLIKESTVEVNQTFRKNDSHLTSFGSQLLFEGQLEKLKFSKIYYKAGELIFRGLQGDLGSKFSCPKLVEKVAFFDNLYVDGVKMEPTLFYEFIPEARNTGTVRVYHNPIAPIAAKVIAFANSFFWGGGTSVGQVWWFSRIFREFHFIWSPEMSIDYINEHSPDIVIAQSIERFFKRLPDQ